MMHNNALFILLLLFRVLSVWSYNYEEKPKPSNSTDWDVIVFTQRWPVTICSQWLKANVNNSCLMPIDNSIWTVHGIWPTKSGTRGPWNCNNKTHFNESSISEIESDLKQCWINIENNTKPTSFWGHEWDKHGTCAMILPTLNTELKFFSKGMEWNKAFNIRDMLLSTSIMPSSTGYTIDRIYSSVRNAINHNPIIQCAVDKNTKESLISEIQICLDRSFNVIDCDPVKGFFENVIQAGNVLTDCSLKKVVVYPSHTLLTPGLTEPDFILESNIQSTLDALLESRNYWITIYKTIKFLIWATI